METEDRHTTQDKRLPCQLLVTGILAFCLILSVAAHLDAQPHGRNQAGSQQIDSRRLNQILTKIEQRLTALEKQRVSHHQPSAPAMHQPGPSFGHQTSLESRVTTLEQKFSQQPATQATNQASSSPDLTTIEARLTVLENLAGSPQQAGLVVKPGAPSLDWILERITEQTNKIDARLTRLYDSIDARLTFLNDNINAHTTAEKFAADLETYSQHNILPSLKTKVLHVVNDAGQTLVKVGQSDSGGAVSLYREGILLAGIGTGIYGGKVNLVNSAGVNMVSIMGNQSGGGSVTVRGPDGGRGALSVGANLSGSLQLYSPEEQGGIWALIDGGAGNITVWGPNGHHNLHTW